LAPPAVTGLWRLLADGPLVGASPLHRYSHRRPWPAFGACGAKSRRP